MLTASAAGVYLIAATPFAEDGALDLPGLDRLVDWYLDRGVDGLTILGQLGEAPKLTLDESLAIARRILARVKVPVVVGVSSPGFASLTQLTQAVMDAGAAGVMVAPPGTLRGDEAISGYCREVGELLGPVPWVLQDFPLAGGPPMSAALVRRIAEACPRGGRCPPPVHPVRPWRHLPAARARARRRRRDDRLLLHRDAGRRL